MTVTGWCVVCEEEFSGLEEYERHSREHRHGPDIRTYSPMPGATQPRRQR